MNSEELKQIYIGDNSNESDDSETSDIDLVIQNFNGLILQTDGQQKMSQAYLEPTQAFKIVKKVNDIKLLTLFFWQKAPS